MTLIELENLSAEELKARYAELVDAAQSSNTRELAERFVSARMDAKFRDLKLAEQGRTINTLNDVAEGLKQKCVELTAQLQKAKDGHAALVQRAEENHKIACDSISGLTAELDATKAKLAAETARAERLKAEATRNFTALSTAEKALKDAMAARELDAVDKGD